MSGCTVFLQDRFCPSGDKTGNVFLRYSRRERAFYCWVHNLVSTVHTESMEEKKQFWLTGIKYAGITLGVYAVLRFLLPYVIPFFDCASAGKMDPSAGMETEKRKETGREYQFDRGISGGGRNCDPWCLCPVLSLPEAV